MRFIKKGKPCLKTMLKLTIEELSALNLILQFVSVSELLKSAMKGFADCNEELTELDREKSDLCWKVLKTLNWCQFKKYFVHYRFFPRKEKEVNGNHLL